ncbi:hypothetical protein ACOMHN_044482 [Nucella lapillus]
MSFHPQKCTTVHMTTSRTTAEREYQLHGHKLQEETQVKYLGVTLKKDLKWEPHITSISSQANRSLGFLRRNVKVASRTIKEAAYKALVRPSLEYASAVWDPYTADDIATLEKVQRSAARWVSHRYRQTSSVEGMLQTPPHCQPTPTPHKKKPPSCRTTYRQMSFFPRTIPEWNLLPAETATAPSLASFQARVAHLK